MSVLLIGDSIRLHAEPFVRDALPSRFHVTSPPDNCRSSQVVEARIREWIPRATVDIVHINCGLHDVRHDPGRNHPVNSIEEYAAHLQNIFAYLGTLDASVIWATSTPVCEALHDAEGNRWYRTDLVEYNRVSVELARSFGFHINDLYDRIAGVVVDGLFQPDGVHFTRAGNQLIGGRIADAIQACEARRETS